MKTISSVAFLLAVASTAHAQQFDELMGTPVPGGAGWEGFTDVAFLGNAFLTLALAAFLGALIAYHPRRLRTADTIEEIEAPKVCIQYAVIGALIGIMVVKYGMVVGFVLFGIGGLIRFRTVMRSAHLTGQVIFVTLIGLSCGLDLPHVAVLATVFGYILMFPLESRITYHLDVQALPVDRFAEAVQAHRAVLESHGSRIFGERKSPDKGRVRFIFRNSAENSRAQIEARLEAEVPAALKGSPDWEVD